MEKWKKLLVRYLFHYNASMLKIETAHEIIDANFPSNLYKYRSFANQSHFDALRRNVLWRCPPHAFNDPYDTTANFDPGRIYTEHLSLEEITLRRTMGGTNFPKKFKNPVRYRDLRKTLIASVAPECQKDDRLTTALNEIEDKIYFDLVKKFESSIKNGYGIISFSEDPLSILMWSHYANSHNGFCIEYSGFGEWWRRICLPVFYRKKITDATRYLSKIDMKDFNPFSALYLSILKSDEWAYEREWRMVFPLGEQYALAEVCMPQPSAIILGAKTTSENEEKMREFCVERGIPMKRVAQRREEFRLMIQE